MYAYIVLSLLAGIRTKDGRPCVGLIWTWDGDSTTNRDRYQPHGPTPRRRIGTRAAFGVAHCDHA